MEPPPQADQSLQHKGTLNPRAGTWETTTRARRSSQAAWSIARTDRPGFSTPGNRWASAERRSADEGEGAMIKHSTMIASTRAGVPCAGHSQGHSVSNDIRYPRTRFTGSWALAARVSTVYTGNGRRGPSAAGRECGWGGEIGRPYTAVISEGEATRIAGGVMKFHLQFAGGRRHRRISASWIC